MYANNEFKGTTQKEHDLLQHQHQAAGQILYLHPQLN